MPRNKYHAQRWGGYDSKHEAERGRQLQLLVASGEITDLREQVRYNLIPAQWAELPRTGKKGQPIKPKRVCLERAIDYVADFVYTTKDGETVVEDAKGYKDGEAYKLFVLKRKLMLYMMGIKVREV